MNTPNQTGSNPSTSGLGSSSSNTPGTGRTSGLGSGMSAGASNEQTAANMGTGDKLQDKAAELARQAKSKGQAELDQYRKTAVGQVETLAESARAAANTLKENDTLGLSHYVADVADGIQNFAGKLRGKSLDELIHDASDLARHNPGLFIAGSIAIGFGLTRFVKASTNQHLTPASGSSLSDPATVGDAWQSQTPASLSGLSASEDPQRSALPGSGLRNDL